MYKVKYLNKATKESYWRTIYADSLGHASLVAKRYARKGFIYGYIEEVLDGTQ